MLDVGLKMATINAGFQRRDPQFLKKWLDSRVQIWGSRETRSVGVFLVEDQTIGTRTNIYKISIDILISQSREIEVPSLHISSLSSQIFINLQAFKKTDVPTFSIWVSGVSGDFDHLRIPMSRWSFRNHIDLRSILSR